MPLTEFQQEFLRNCSHRWNIKTGATRSGKTYLDCAVTIPKRICAARDEGLLVMLGNTLGTLERNVLEPMRALWGPELVGVVRTSAAGNVVQLFGRKVYVLGADNKKHIARIQGAAFEYAYGDEITTWDEGVFQMLKSRLSCPHSHFDGTCNPDNPQHWFKRFLDSDADIYCQAYTIDDNPTLPPEFVAQLKKEYAGTVYYNRFILGQWAAAGGIIYQPFADSLAEGGDRRFLWPADKPCKPWRVHIGVDFGGNGSQHAFVATGILPYYSGVVGLASQRVDPRNQDADYLANQLLTFCPQHWFKRFLDSDADIYCQAYTIDDNPTLPPEFVAQLKKEYAGTVYYNRFILGQWAAAGGIIYQPFADSLAEGGDRRFLWPADKPCKPWRVHIGVDFGGNGSQHAFVATGILPYYSGVVGLASQRVDPRNQDADYLANQLLTFCLAVFARYGEIHYMFCDSAEQTLINHIRTRLRASKLYWLADRVNNSAKIQIIDRIRLTSILMGGGRFWYMPEAATLRDALASALWSQKRPGVDERLDDGTTDIDTLDAFEYTIERDYRRLTAR